MCRPLRLGSLMSPDVPELQGDAGKPVSCRRRPEAFLLSVLERQAGVA